MDSNKNLVRNAWFACQKGKFPQSSDKLKYNPGSWFNP